MYDNIFLHNLLWRKKMSRIRDLREDNDKEQKEVAKLLGISQQYYSRYELEQVEMPMKHYIKLAKYYGVSLDYLAGIIEVPRPLYTDSTKTMFTAKELAILKAYEENKDLQKAIDIILNIR